MYDRCWYFLTGLLAKMSLTFDLNQAEQVVSEYGKLLASIEPSIYGLPESTLPHSKEEIKAAIQVILINVAKENPQIKDSLVQAYVYLAQFIPDDIAELARNGKAVLEAEKKEQQDLELANQAIRIISGIKAEMEDLMAEIRLLMD